MADVVSPLNKTVHVLLLHASLLVCGIPLLLDHNGCAPKYAG